MPRFEVGKKYYFIEIDYTSADAASYMYAPWSDTLNEIKVTELTCVEHHKVPGEWDDEKKWDGFIFRDAGEHTWYNQYPVAAYGQHETSEDWRVRPQRGASEIDAMSKVEFATYDAGFTEACKFIENILRACNPKSPFSYLGDEKVEELSALKKFQVQVIEAVEKASGGKVKIGPRVITGSDGEVRESSAVLRAKLVCQQGEECLA